MESGGQKLFGEMVRHKMKQEDQSAEIVALRAELARLTAENGRLRAALTPFAVYAAQIDGHFTSQDYPDGCPMILSPRADSSKEIVHLGDCRRARSALAEGQSTGDT